MTTIDQPRPAWTTKIPLAGRHLRMIGYDGCDQSRMHLAFVTPRTGSGAMPTRLWIVPGASCLCLASCLGLESSMQLAEEFQRFLHTDNAALVALDERPQNLGQLMMGMSPRHEQRPCSRACERSADGQNGCSIRRILASLEVTDVILEYPRLPKKGRVPGPLAAFSCESCREQASHASEIFYSESRGERIFPQ